MNSVENDSIKEIMKNIKRDDFELLSLNFEQNSEFDESTQFKHNWSYKIISHSNDSLEIEIVFNGFFEPKSFFNFNAKYLAKFKLVSTVTDEELNKVMDTIIQPCGHYNSMILGELTEKAMGSPMIIPPIVELQN